MGIWTQEINNLTPEQTSYLSQLMSGSLYGTDAATKYVNSVLYPELEDTYGTSMGQLKQTYGPMSLGSSYKVAANEMTKNLAEEKAKKLAETLWNWKQLEAQAQVSGLNRDAFTTLAGYNAESTGGGVPSYGGGGSGNSGVGYSGNTLKSTSGTGTGSFNTTGSSTPTYGSDNYYYDWLTGTSSNTPSSTGTSSEYTNPYTGEIYNYSPGGYTDTSNNYDTGYNDYTNWSGYNYDTGNDYSDYDYDYSDYDFSGFW